MTIRIFPVIILCSILQFSRYFAFSKQNSTSLREIYTGLDTRELESKGIDVRDIMSSGGITLIRSRKLYSRNSLKFIRIARSYIDGRGQLDDKDAQLRIESTGFGSQIRIRSAHCDCYLCANNKGHITPLPADQTLTHYGCVFIQGEQQAGYHTFKLKLNPTWYLGITNRGGVKPARKTRQNQRAACFLVV